MEAVGNLISGFATALSGQNLLFAFIGCFLGTMIGVLPGIGPTAGIAILIPLTFRIDSTGAIIMLAAIYYGSQYGGTITSVLMNIPGEASSAITCLDGHEMAKKGRAGVALSIAAIGSFIGGTVATVGLVVAAPPLASLALRFGPPEFFALMVVGLSLILALSGKSLVKALLMGMFGLLVGTVGMDPGYGVPRFTLGQMELLKGVPFVPVIMGLLGLSDLLLTIESPVKAVITTRMSSLMPSRQDMMDSAFPIARGTALGFVLGLIPGLNAVVASVLSYTVEKKISKHPERFGEGTIEGVAGPETANNAFANAAMIPLLALGIPGSPAIAVLMGALLMNGIIPGPFMFTEHANLVWGVIASLYVGNIMLLILNLPLIPMWVQLLKIPYSLLFVVILCFMLVGAYSIDNSVFGIVLMIIFGIIGYFCKKLDLPMTPLVLTFILGPLMERSLRQSLEISRGDLSILVTRPLSVTLLIVGALIIVSSAIKLMPREVEAARVGDAEI